MNRLTQSELIGIVMSVMLIVGAALFLLERFQRK
jgi:hypothetical protein